MPSLKKLLLWTGLIFAFSYQLAFAETQAITRSNADLTLEGARKIAAHLEKASDELGKKIAIAIVDSKGEIILLVRGDGVGPHNVEAARRKAYTSLSTKTATLELARKSRANRDTENLAQLPELLLLGGGQPLWSAGNLVGAVGVAGGGGPENDDLIASKSAQAGPGLNIKNETK